jgi:hypothetical protein
MDPTGRNLGGRAYLVSKLQDRGASRRRAVRIVNMVFEEMSQALARGEYVEFPFGYLKAEKGRRWDAPLAAKHHLNEDGWKLLEVRSSFGLSRAGAGGLTSTLSCTSGTVAWEFQ